MAKSFGVIAQGYLGKSRNAACVTKAAEETNATKDQEALFQGSQSFAAGFIKFRTLSGCVFIFLPEDTFR